MKKRLIDGLLGVVIGIILILFLMPKHENVDELLIAKDKQHAKEIEALNHTIKQLQTKDLLLLNTIKILRYDKTKVIREKEIYRLENERLKKKPIPIGNLNDKQIDSLLSTIYSR
jgi:hypothetical protein